jgi:uridine phosphorylase
MGTGIGTDNIDIVLNELDALVNIDLQKREPRAKHRSLRIVRLGTCGALQPDLPVDSFIVSAFGIGLDGVLHYYAYENTPPETAPAAGFHPAHGLAGEPSAALRGGGR